LKRALAVFLAVLVAKAACAGETAEQRIDSRTFPSVFQAWNPATPLPGKTADEMIALHDLFFTSTGALGLQWIGGEGEGIAFTPASLQAAARKVARLRQLNPHLVILAEIRYRDAPSGFFPDDSPYWMRDASGRRIIGWPEGGYFKIDIGNAKLRALVAQKAAAIAATGFIDGVMLDWWIDDPQRLALIRAVRHAVGDKLILVNGNEGEFPLTAPYVNGTYMECTRHATPQDWSPSPPRSAGPKRPRTRRTSIASKPGGTPRARTSPSCAPPPRSRSPSRTATASSPIPTRSPRRTISTTGIPFGTRDSVGPSRPASTN
jgi:hypothetical protein